MEHTNMPLEKRFYPFKGGSIGTSKQIMKLGEIFNDYISIMQNHPDSIGSRIGSIPHIPYDKAFVKESLYKNSSRSACNNTGTNT